MSLAICPPQKHVRVFFEVAAVAIGFRVQIASPRPFIRLHGQSPAQLGGRLMEELLHDANMRQKTREVKP